MTVRPERPVLARSGRSAKVLGAGVAGVAGVFAVAQGAHAAPTPSASPSPSPSSHTASVKARAATPKAAVTTPVTPQYGLQKIRVGVRVKDGSYVAPGTSTAGTVLHVTEVDQDGKTVYDEDCTTGAVAVGSTASYCTFHKQNLVRRAGLKGRTPQVVQQPGTLQGSPNDYYTPGAGSTVTLRQVSARPGLVLDPATSTVGPCTATPGTPLCGFTGSDFKVTNVIFEDTGFPPVAKDDTARTDENTPVTIAIAKNDTAEAPITSVSITTEAKHGTARLISTEGADPSPTAAPSTSPSAAPSTSDSSTPNPATLIPPLPTLSTLTLDQRAVAGVRSLAAVTSYRAVYTPAAGFTGVDTFDYTIRTANGTSTARVTVTVVGTAATSSASSGAAISNSADALPPTGARSSDMLGYAAALLLAGGGALALGRERRRGRHAR